MSRIWCFDFIRFLSLVLMVGIIPCRSFGAVPLVEKGQAVAEIVLAADSNASMRNAALDLQDFIKRMSGAELPIVDQPTEAFENRVFAGAGKYAEEAGFKPGSFSTSGYEVWARGKTVVLSGVDRLSSEIPYRMTREDSRYLRGDGEKPADFPSEGLQAWWDFCGEEFTTWQLGLPGSTDKNPELGIYINDDTGTWYAAIDLLEQLGVRFYGPYEDGTIIPQMQDISVREQHTVEEAVFGRRAWHYRSANIDSLRWMKRQKVGTYAPIIFNHTTVAIYASRTQHEKHPEYLACDVDGKPFLRSYAGKPPVAGGVPRYTNPDFRRASVVLMNKMFEAVPELYAVSMGAPDGGVQIDPRDLDLYGGPGDSLEFKAANYVWDYHVFLARELKKSHPDKFLIYLAPGGARGVPSKIGENLPDNIIFGWPQAASAYRVLGHVNRDVLDFRADWFKAYRPRGKSPIWDYFLYYRRDTQPRFPVFFTESLQKEMQEMISYSDGKFIEILVTSPTAKKVTGPGHWASRIDDISLVQLMVYWQNRLLWDPYADREAMLTEYYKLYFGPAADAMQKFHEFAETVWMRQESRSVTQSLGFLKEEDITVYFKLLADARALTEEGTAYERRIADMESSYAPLKNYFENIRRKGPLLKAGEVPDDITLEAWLDDATHAWMELLESGVAGQVPEENKTRVKVAFSQDREHFYLAAVCYENNMDNLRAHTTIPDAREIFSDDVIELYVDSPERSFFKIVVNANGTIWDESQDLTIIDRDTMAILWDPDSRAVARKHADRWEIALSFPTEDLGNTPPTRETPWGLQIGRSRMAGGKYQNYRLAPGEGRYDTQNQWANLWMEP